MKILLVYCHPRTDSFVHALKDVTLESLTAAGHSVDLLDLYAENFQPILTADERGRYNDPAANQQGVEGDIARLKQAEALVFVYPTWWYGLPAMLKGWFDRVWVPGVAFEINNGVVKPSMVHIRKVGVVTTMGAPWWFSWFVGHPGRMFLSRGLRAICAPGCGFVWCGLHNMDSVSLDRRQRFMAKVRRRFADF